MNPQVSNPNDFKVVVFKNATDFDFTPEMGCMFNSNPIFGISGNNGIKAGESITLPYHVGHLLANNLAKAAMTRSSSLAPQLDPQGQPIIAAIWDSVRLETMKNSYLTELYTENRPIAMSETDRLMAKVEELRKTVDTLLPNAKVEPEVVDSAPNSELTAPPVQPGANVYQDKAEVIAELEKRGVQHDKRKSKADLEKLLIA